MTSTIYTLRTTDFHDLVVVAHQSGEYTARLDASSVVIARDGVWAGTGVWDSEGRNIVGCAADLPDEVYTALDAGVAQLAAQDAVRAAASKDADAFFAEFGEALNPDETDWDATAWTIVAEDLGLNRADAVLFAIYQAALVSESARLAAPSREQATLEVSPIGNGTHVMISRQHEDGDGGPEAYGTGTYDLPQPTADGLTHTRAGGWQTSRGISAIVFVEREAPALARHLEQAADAARHEVPQAAVSAEARIEWEKLAAEFPALHPIE